MGVLALLGSGEVQLSTTLWLFLQTLCIDIAYLSFQTIFFERFIACFKVKGNVGFFIITIDFVGYVGTLALLLFKELKASHIDWAVFYNEMSVFVGITCCIAFAAAAVYVMKAKKIPDTGSARKVNDMNSYNELLTSNPTI